MHVTARQLNRATLSRQLLLRRAPLDVVEAVRRLCAIQAQEAASPYLALWDRLEGFEATDLDAAFADREVVKASLLRMTLHAVHAADYPSFHGAMVSNLRASRLYDGRFKSTGLTIADADGLLPALAEYASSPRTSAQIEAHLGQLLDERLGEGRKRAWWALRTFAPLHHAPTTGPWSFRSPSSFVSAGPVADARSPEESVQWLLLRYLEAFGPASAHDFGQFTMLRQPVVRQALTSLVGQLTELEGPGGVALYDVVGGILPAEDALAPARLMPMWDSTLLAYADRSRVIPEGYRRVVIRQNGDVLPTLLVDGYVAGVWRPVEGGIEATCLPPAVRFGLERPRERGPCIGGFPRGP